MTNNEDKEQLFRDDLHQFLLSVDMIDERLPEAPDLEELWQPILRATCPMPYASSTANIRVWRSVG